MFLNLDDTQPLWKEKCCLRDAVAVTLAAVLGCGPHSTHLWYLLFAADELQGTIVELLVCLPYMVWVIWNSLRM